MFGLLGGQNLMNHTIRSALPMTIPFIVADLGLSANQSAKLLAAFFPGYVITQIPGGMLAQIVGGKIVTFCNLFGNGLMLALAPLAAATASPVNAMAVAFFAAGTRPLGTCPGPAFASRVIFCHLALSVGGRI